jgi:hypothetical protein
MVRCHNHYQKLSKLIDSFGLEAYGTYWVINELIFSAPEKSMSKPELKKAIGNIANPKIVDCILENREHFYCIDGRYFSELERKNDLSPDMAYRSLDKAGLHGRGFSKIIQIYGVSEKFMMEQFDKWKESNFSTVFKDDKHVFNSFNLWMRNCEKPKSKVDKIDWDKL